MFESTFVMARRKIDIAKSGEKIQKMCRSMFPSVPPSLVIHKVLTMSLCLEM